MKLTQTVAPAENPITLEQARTWLAIEVGVTEDDTAITECIEEVEDFGPTTARSVIISKRCSGCEISILEITCDGIRLCREHKPTHKH